MNWEVKVLYSNKAEKFRYQLQSEIGVSHHDLSTWSSQKQAAFSSFVAKMNIDTRSIKPTKSEFLVWSWNLLRELTGREVILSELV